MEIFAESTGSRDPFINNRDVEAVVELLLKKPCNLIINNLIYILRIAEESDFKSAYQDIEEFYDDEPNSKKLRLLSSIKTNLSNIYKKDIGTLSNLRGAILELFTYKSMLEKYNCTNSNCDNFKIDCTVTIDGYTTEKTVDVFAFDQLSENGECYECKIGINNLDEEDIKILRGVCRKSNNILSPKVISFSDVETIKNKFRELNIDTDGVVYFGLENFESRDFLYQ